MTQQADWIKEREAIRARLEAATPGPWIDKGGDAFGVILSSGKCLLATSYMLAPNSVDFRFEADREFVGHAPEDLRRLLAKSEEDERGKASLKATAEQWFNEAQAERQHKDAAKATLALREQRISELMRILEENGIMRP